MEFVTLAGLLVICLCTTLLFFLVSSQCLIFFIFVRSADADVAKEALFLLKFFPGQFQLWQTQKMSQLR